MTIQYIIVGLIIASALGSIAYRLIRSVKKPAGPCGGCVSSCGGCSIHELKARKL
ncbi:MAG: FeoB-associated Cys-rich membrane protein [Bacteroidetes bacterium]|nr:FeoB-associated Cys-rich membrane protein [Bacteroidota bacterium]